MPPTPARRRSLPLAPPARRGLPLLDESREIDRVWRPSYVVWEVTLACDLACHHCGSRAGRARPDELSTAEALDLVDQLAALGANEVTLIGGEAYLRDDWTQLIARIAHHKMRCGMATGGRGLTLDRVKAARDAGLTAISVSVDGLEGEHDAQRGLHGSFASAMAAMDHVRAAGGIRLTANSQINRVSLPVVEQLFEAIAERGAKAWQVQLTAAMGRAADEPRIFLDPYEVLEVLPRLARLKREGERRGVMLWPGNNIGYFGPFEGVIRGDYATGYRGACGAGRMSLGIEANGDVKGCPSLPSDAYVGGNVREHPLVDLWERSRPLRFTRDLAVHDLKGFCATCYYAHECRGGCHWTSHVLLGERGDNPFCHHRALELLREGVRERVRCVEAAPGLPFDHARYEVYREPWPASERAAIERLHAEVEAETCGPFTNADAR
ncbi:MAG: radical SAM protein [Deltaproteobacteria bacterium]|nr:radical SAM protein [Deltaproteobacteria bacterium]